MHQQILCHIIIYSCRVWCIDVIYYYYTNKRCNVLLLICYYDRLSILWHVCVLLVIRDRLLLINYYLLIFNCILSSSFPSCLVRDYSWARRPLKPGALAPSAAVALRARPAAHPFSRPPIDAARTAANR